MARRTFRSRQAGQNGFGQRLFLLFIKASGIDPGFFDRLKGVLLFGFRSFQDEKIECREGSLFETQGGRTVGDFILQIRPGPIQDRHKVVANHRDAAGAEVAYRLFVVIDVPFKSVDLSFDIFVNRHTLHHGPSQTSFFDLLFPFFDLFHRPDLSDGKVVQSGDNARGSSLTNILQCDRIVRTVPSPCLFELHIPVFGLNFEEG